MTQTSDCPACGAPIEYHGSDATIHCHFCGAELTVNNSGEGPRFQVLSKPSPQAEVLADQNQQVISNVAAEVAGAAEAAGATQASAEIPDQGSGARVYEFPPVSAASGQASPFDLPPASSGPARAYDAPSTPPGGNTMRILGMDLPRWVVILIAALLGLCVLCSCAVAAIIIVSARNFR
jgi:hypothetical protein